MPLPPTPIDPREGHRLWASSYDADPNPLLQLEERTLRPHLEDLAGKLVVDVGCGTGRWMAYAYARGAGVLGFDLTREMLVQAAAKPGLPGNLACSDAQALPCVEQIADLTLCSFCISYAPDAPAVFAELARITRPTGRIIVSDIHPAAIAAGWKRTFRRQERLYEMKTDPARSLNPIRLGLQSGLTLWRVLEPRLGEPERHLFEQAGKLDAYEAVLELPALLITLWDRNPTAG